MAQKKGGGTGRGASPNKKKAAKKAAPPAGNKRKSGAGEIASPPNDLIATFGELISRARANPTVQNLQALAGAAAEMEKRFSDVRREAELAVKGLDASTRLFGEEGDAVASAPLPTPLPSEPPQVVAPEEKQVPSHGLLSLKSPRLIPESTRALSPPSPTAGAGADQGVALDSFFTSVVSSVIDAQKELDKQSLQYARSRTRTAIPPTLYSIPRVQAEIKVGFNNVTSQGFNILLAKDETQDQSSFESTIQFDVVASPPPPGPPDQFTQPIPEFLVAGDELDGLLAVSGLPQASLALAIALRLPRTKPDHQKYALLAPLPAGSAASQFQVIRVSETDKLGELVRETVETFPATATALTVLADLQIVYQTISGWLNSVSS